MKILANSEMAVVGSSKLWFLGMREYIDESGLLSME